MDRVVIDTNIFVSGISLSKNHTPPALVLKAWRNKKFVLVTSPDLIAEIKEVLYRPKILHFTGVKEREVDTLLEEIEQRAYITKGTYEVEKITIDPDDNSVLACALEGKATHIITGDKQSLLPLKEYHQIRILTPHDFLSFLSQ